MAKKANYELNMGMKGKQTVTGEVYGNFGIHKRDDGWFAITHIPSGMLVVSDQKKKKLVELIADHDEFREEAWEKENPGMKAVSDLALVIRKFYSLGYASKNDLEKLRNKG